MVIIVIMVKGNTRNFNCIQGMAVECGTKGLPVYSCHGLSHDRLTVTHLCTVLVIGTTYVRHDGHGLEWRPVSGVLWNSQLLRSCSFSAAALDALQLLTTGRAGSGPDKHRMYRIKLNSTPPSAFPSTYRAMADC